MCRHGTPILFVCCPATITLTCHFCFQSPCFWEDYISAVKAGEIAFPTLLVSRVMGLSCKGSVGRGRKESSLPWKSPLPQNDDTTEEEKFNWKLDVCTALFSVDITGTDTHPVMTHNLINYRQGELIFPAVCLMSLITNKFLIWLFLSSVCPLLQRTKNFHICDKSIFNLEIKLVQCC